LIGQVPQVLVLLIVFSVHGMGMNNAEGPASNNLFLLMALSLQWFSQHDLMDGLRARRQKSGSPLGRVIDEALDLI